MHGIFSPCVSSFLLFLSLGASFSSYYLMMETKHGDYGILIFLWTWTLNDGNKKPLSLSCKGFAVVSLSQEFGLVMCTMNRWGNPWMLGWKLERAMGPVLKKKRRLFPVIPFYGIVRIRLIACMMAATGITSVHRLHILDLSLVCFWVVSCFSNYYLCTIRADSIRVYFTLTRRCWNWWSSPRTSLPYWGGVRCSRHSLFGATMAHIVIHVCWNFLSGRPPASSHPPGASGP